MTSSSSSSKYLNSKLFPIFTQIHLASSKSKATFDPSSTDTTTSPSAGDKSKKKTTFQDDIRSKKTAKELLNQEQLKELREHQERRATYGGNLGDVSREAAFYLPPIREELPSPDPSQELPPSIRTSNGSIPTSIQEEMKSKGFKSYSRSPDGRVSPLNLWCKHEFDLKTIKSEQRMRKSLDLEAIRRRRKSTRANLGRRKSVMQKIFGEAGTDRRFSEDLYPEPEDVHDDGADRETPTDGPTEETSRVIFYQVFIPFLIAGFDNVGAGMILDRVQHWTVFRNVPELFILVASFLGLKGNLEMTLAARLATMANMGQLDDKKQRWTIAYGNIALVQGQAIVVAFMASLIAIFVNYLKEPDFDVSDFLLLCATGLLTASVTGFAMANLMVGATVLARKIGVNPDNVSALIASIMGDISAITLLALSARFFYNVTHIAWISPLVILFYVSILPLCLMSARNNPFTKSIVGQGWIPIIVAMFISSAAGFIFDVAVGIFETIAVVQPIINGVGGNLVAVQASRISTYFHLRCPIGTLPEEYEGKHLLKSPQAAFFGKSEFLKDFFSFVSF